MNLNDFNSLNNNNEPKDNFLGNLIGSLQNTLKNFIKNSHSPNLNLKQSICVITDINDERLSLVNTENGQDLDIYVSHSNDKTKELHSKGITDNIFEISKEDLYSLNLGSNIILKDGQCNLYHGEIEIKNSEAAAKLENLYFCLEQEKNAEYLVSNISDGKIYLTNTKEGGYFSILEEAYPNFKVGDIVKNVNGKYVLI